MILDMTTKNIAVAILPQLISQVNTFLDELEKYNDVRPQERKRDKKDYDFLRYFYEGFFTGRNKRADEVSSSEYQAIRKLALEQFPTPTLWNLCMDGRVKTVLTNGATAGVGASIRVPGGILREFVRDPQGNFRLLPESNFAGLLDRALHWPEGDIVTEVFDSHVGCAARNVEEQARGREPKDSGLLSDILHKRDMLQAVTVFVNEAYGERKHVIGIQTSFDPHDGYMYMGLETENALSFARQHALTQVKNEGKMYRWEYTDEVLAKVVANKKAIYTKKLIELPAILNAFSRHIFKADWAKDYVATSVRFWQSIADMKAEILPLIQEQLVSIYPQLDNSSELARKELEERAILLLTNAFVAFINNQREYPYGIHREECVKVSRGGFPPYDISAFVVLGSDEKNICANIELAAALVRQNRRHGRIKDHSGIFTDPEEFAQAPVPLVVQETLEETLDSGIWEPLTKIDWSDLPKNWDTLSDRDFFNYLETKGDIHLKLAIGMNTLRRHMAILFDPDQVMAGRLVSHHKVAIPVMVDKNRTNYFIIPFVKLGFA